MPAASNRAIAEILGLIYTMESRSVDALLTEARRLAYGPQRQSCGAQDDRAGVVVQFAPRRDKRGQRRGDGGFTDDKLQRAGTVEKLKAKTGT